MQTSLFYRSIQGDCIIFCRGFASPDRPLALRLLPYQRSLCCLVSNQVYNTQIRYQILNINMKGSATAEEEKKRISLYAQSMSRLENYVHTITFDKIHAQHIYMNI